jgi:hypothetical protein
MADDVISWRALPERSPVVDANGEEIGTTEEVLADDQGDIFHGLAVKLRRGGTVEITADRIPRMTTERVYTTIAPEEVEALPAWEA